MVPALPTLPGARGALPLARQGGNYRTAGGTGGGQFGVPGQHSGAGPPSEKPVVFGALVMTAEMVPASINAAMSVLATIFISFSPSEVGYLRSDSL